jgi:NDP-sugar pyrophosphorylase family protein
MTRLLICPSERSGVPFLSQRLPLANVPLLGQSLLEYWLSSLAIGGVKNVVILAHDRPELALEVAGAGERWGLEARVVNESRELSAAEALLKYATDLKDIPAEEAIGVLDHFPGLPEQRLFASYQSWFAAIRSWMPSALMPDRVGVNETLPGVWKGCHTHVSPKAQLRSPCWIGQHVFVGAHAIVGPGAILEDGSFVEPGAELAESWIGPDTFVGQLAQIKSSLAWGNTLVNWQTGSEAQVADPFLLCAVRRSRSKRTPGWFRKLCDHYERNKGDAGEFWKQLALHKQG